MPSPSAAHTRLTLADLFDAEWYRERYPATAARDPWQDYASAGWRLGRDPGPHFDADWYLAVHADASGEPLQHYVMHSDDDQHRPNPLFDPGWYRAQYPQATGWAPFAHYVRHGRAAGLFPGPAVAAVASESVPTARVQPSVTVIVEAGSDLVHADRCIQALRSTEAHSRADLVVVVDASADRQWQLLGPGPKVVTRAPPAVDTEYVLLLRGDTEPLPGLLDRMWAATGDPATPVVAEPRATLVAPEIPSDLPRLARLGLPPQAALLHSSQWPTTLVELRDRDVTSVDAGILSHLPLTIARAAGDATGRWDPRSWLGITLLTAEVDRPVARTAMRAWLQTAVCDIPAATVSLEQWRHLLADMPADTRDTLPRLFRRRDQLVADVIQEALLQPDTTTAAASAIAADDAVAARSLLARNPGSYPAAVAVVTLRPSAVRAADEPDVTAAIPHVIVQGWFDSPMPDECLALTRSWGQMNPTWTHLMFDTDSAAEWITTALGGQSADVFRSATPVGKSNLFRYAYLSVHGGVWSDIDDRCIRYVAPLTRSASLVVVQETIGAVADNFIAAAPGHPALIATRDEAFANVKAGFRESPWLANGPALFTRHVATWLASAGGADCRVLTGADLSSYVSMHEQLHYKETPLAWDVPTDPWSHDDHWGEALSDRQRALQRKSYSRTCPDPSTRSPRASW